MLDHLIFVHYKDFIIIKAYFGDSKIASTYNTNRNSYVHIWNCNNEFPLNMLFLCEAFQFIIKGKARLKCVACENGIKTDYFSLTLETNSRGHTWCLWGRYFVNARIICIVRVKTGTWEESHIILFWNYYIVFGIIVCLPDPIYSWCLTVNKHSQNLEANLTC